MAKSPNADSTSAGFSTVPSTAYSNLDSPINFNPSESSGEGTGDTPPTVGYTGYEGIDWSRLPGYCMRKHGSTDLDDFMASIRKPSTQPAPLPSATRDEYTAWIATTDPGDCLVDDPIQYWLLRRRQYPRLSRMAIDLFSIPAMSSEPERIFSLAGHMVTAQRGRLQADIIGAAQCISSWERSGAIQISK